jgi:hypothetical protein
MRWPVDVDTGLRLLAAHRNALNGKAPRGGPRPQRATREETDAAILKKLNAIARQREQAAAHEEAKP